MQGDTTLDPLKKVGTVPLACEIHNLDFYAYRTLTENLLRSLKTDYRIGKMAKVDSLMGLDRE